MRILQMLAVIVGLSTRCLDCHATEDTEEKKIYVQSQDILIQGKSIFVYLGSH